MTERSTGFSLSVPDSSSRGGGSRRSLVQATPIGGRVVSGLIEWVTAEPDHELLNIVGERIPSGDEGEWRPEEAHTPRISSTCRDGARVAIIYECSPMQHPTDLLDVMLMRQKPTPDERRALARIVATQIRSLHVHFQLSHPMLCTESVVFFSQSRSSRHAAMLLDLTRPYILDWGCRPSSPISNSPNTAAMFQHPGCRTSTLVTPQWSNQAWALLMVLSEIADWRPIERRIFRDEAALREATLRRVHLVTNASWKNETTAAIFRYGFTFLEETPEVLVQYSHWKIKGFYDHICQLFEPVAAVPLQ